MTQEQFEAHAADCPECSRALGYDKGHDDGVMRGCSGESHKTSHIANFHRRCIVGPTLSLRLSLSNTGYTSLRVLARGFERTGTHSPPQRDGGM